MIFLKLRKRQALARKNIIILIVLIFFVNFIFPNFFVWIAYVIYSPVWYLNALAKNDSSYFSFKPNIQLMKENLDLREKNREFTDITDELVNLKIENIELKKLGETLKKDDLIATVIAKPNVSIYDSILIDIGENKGVEIGDFVAIENNAIIGKIIETQANFSKASLFSTAGNELDVVVGHKNIQTKAYGQGNGNLYIKLPRDLAIQNGDPIKIPLLGNQIIGNVTKIEFDDSSAYSRIIFSIPTNIYEMRWVGIKKPLTSEK